jgi:two-component system, OmpR family, response regulator
MNVLLIDDNNEITEMISFFLSTMDIACDVENNGVKSLEKIKDHKYDVILLDLTMPVFSGYDVFDYLKKNDLLKKNNVVIFTASFILEEKIEQMLKEGVKEILRKPISINSIIETINKYK